MENYVKTDKKKDLKNIYSKYSIDERNYVKRLYELLLIDSNLTLRCSKRTNFTIDDFFDYSKVIFRLIKHKYNIKVEWFDELDGYTEYYFYKELKNLVNLDYRVN